VTEVRKHEAAVATIVDVAALAGVSTATVSRVMNGKPVRPDLAEAVRRAAEALNYSPNRTARTLRRRLGEVIALILPDIENPFFTSLARGVEDVAQQHGYSVVMCNSDDDVDKEARYLRIAASDSMAGIIISPADETTSLETALGSIRSAVVVDRPVQDDVDQVVLDNVAISRRAVRALIDAGRTRIGCVTGPANISTARTRAEVWHAELLAAGLPAPDELLRYANFRVDGGRLAAEQLLALSEQPDAILATNNLVGVGALQILAERGLSVHDVAISVVGSLPFATSSMADISVVPLYPREMGITAAQMLMERMTGTVVGPGRRVTLMGDVGPGPSDRPSPVEI
jgi:LacI family transcriptional regulator